jgi:hypothetical protein
VSRGGSDICPHCGEAFPRGRPACPHCGSDAATGWLPDEEQEAAGTDLSFTHLDDEAYERFLEQEGLAVKSGAPRAGSRGAPPRATRGHLRLLAGALLLAVALGLAVILLTT